MSSEIRVSNSGTGSGRAARGNRGGRSGKTPLIR